MKLKAFVLFKVSHYEIQGFLHGLFLEKEAQTSKKKKTNGVYQVKLNPHAKIQLNQISHIRRVTREWSKLTDSLCLWIKTLHGVRSWVELSIASSTSHWKRDGFSQISLTEKLDSKKPEEWKRWIEWFECYHIAAELDEKDDTVYAMGENANGILRSFNSVKLIKHTM